MSKLDRIKSKPKEVIIMGETYKIFPLSFEDQLDISGVKKDGDKIDMGDDKTKNVVKDLVFRKLTESLIADGENPTLEDLKKVDTRIISEYMTNLLKISSDEGGSKKE